MAMSNGQNVLGAADTSGGGQININSASEKELDNLPAIGAVTAQKIIAGRPYGSVEELLQKKIVGKKAFEQIKDKIMAN
jgi:competence protein ComEA